MSKVDAQRAMREARFAARQAAQPARSAAPARPAAARNSAGPKTPAAAGSSVATADAPVPSVTEDAVTVAVEPAAPQADSAGSEAVPELCGHRNMGGKGCTRPAGHTEKNHRYK